MTCFLPDNLKKIGSDFLDTKNIFFTYFNLGTLEKYYLNLDKIIFNPKKPFNYSKKQKIK
jgi:hypothetical protein